MNKIIFDDEEELKLLIIAFSFMLISGVYFDTVVISFIYILGLSLWSILFNLYIKVCIR